ncbi:hypothetical protein HUU05_05685 [candidate division KSB1 bacterium]|nr:hypothetical protein [candidate division KSB1 bacterium]
MIRIIFYLLLCYLVYQILRMLFVQKPQTNARVQGRPKNEPLDLSKQMVEDAKFEEIKKK